MDSRFVFLLVLLYGLINGFIILFLPYFVIKHFGYAYICLYSVMLFLSTLFYFLIDVSKFKMKNLMILGALSVFIYCSSLFLFFKTGMLITIIFAGISDSLIFLSSKTYIVRVSKDVKNDISKWSIFFTIGYILASIWPVLAMKYFAVVRAILFVLSVVCLISALLLESDKPSETRKIDYKKLIKQNLTIFPGYFIILLLFYMFFIDIPVVLKNIHVPATVISLTFALLNIGPIVGDLILMSEKYSNMNKSMFITISLLVIMSPFIIFLIILRNYLTAFIIFLTSLLIELFLNNLFVVEVEFMKNKLNSDDVSIVSSIAEEFSYIVAPLFLILGYMVNLFLIPVLSLLEFAYILVYIYKRKTTRFKHCC